MKFANVSHVFHVNFYLIELLREQYTKTVLDVHEYIIFLPMYSVKMEQEQYCINLLISMKCYILNCRVKMRNYLHFWLPHVICLLMHILIKFYDCLTFLYTSHL